jgi:hypothetical protein
VSICPVHLNSLKTKNLQCLKQPTFSGFNPPSDQCKMKGDFMYIHNTYIITSEDKRFHFTSYTKGFFFNQSTDESIQNQTA